MAARLPRFQKGHALSHRDLNAISEAISEQESGEFQRARRRRPADFLCKIVLSGPGGQADFPDSRYWVRQVRLQTAIPPNNEIPSGMQEIAFGTSTPVWAEAINLSEVILGTHSLPHDTIVRIFEIRDWAGQTHFVFTTSATASSIVEDVKIAYVVDCTLGDCSGEENSNWLIIQGLTTPTDGRHLKCYRVNINGVPQTNEPYLAVLPNTGHSIIEFLPVAWNINSTTQTSFLAFRNDGVWRMGSFGEGEQWTTPPTNLCGATEPDPDPTGACCILGVCSILDQATCELDGTYQGDDTTCVPDDPCGAPATGACCFISGSCTEGHTPSSCSFQGGIYQGDGTACGSCGQPEACCLGAGCFEWPVEFCNAAGGVPMGGTCTPDPCGGGAQAPTGRRSGRRV